MLLPCRHLASVELEILHDAAEVSPYLPGVSPKQLVAVVSAPRLFIDRTGLGIKPVQDGRYFPDFGGYALLGDSAVGGRADEIHKGPLCRLAAKEKGR